MTRVLLACCGLDHALRGYESFAREAFTELRDAAGIDLQLAKGSGLPALAEHRAPCLRRDRPAARGIARAAGGARPFRVEAASFALGLVPLLARLRPHVVYVSEWDTARGLAALRRPARGGFRILLANGGFAETGFDHLDHVQELTPAARDHVVARGADPRRHSVLPYGFAIPASPATVGEGERRALRARLGLPADRPILISVAALNRTHKRLDYVIDELAGLAAEHRPFLLLAGQPDGETPAILAHAERRLGAGGYAARTVPAAEVPLLLRASDVFVLASLHEAQGRALVEAMAEGLPCIAHDHPVMRYAVGAHGRIADLSKPGALARELIAASAAAAGPGDAARERHRFVYERFSWERLRPRYVELFAAIAAGAPAPGTTP